MSAMMANYEIAYQMAHNTIQFMEGPQKVKFLGKYSDVLAQEYGETRLAKNSAGQYSAVANMDALDIDFDVLVQDGSIPSGEYADTWVQLMQNSAAHPELYQNLDFVKIWLHIARLLGAKNANDFRKAIPNVNIQGDEQIAAGTQAGNLVPLAEVA